MNDFVFPLSGMRKEAAAWKTIFNQIAKRFPKLSPANLTRLTNQRYHQRYDRAIDTINANRVKRAEQAFMLNPSQETANAVKRAKSDPFAKFSPIPEHNTFGVSSGYPGVGEDVTILRGYNRPRRGHGGMWKGVDTRAIRRGEAVPNPNDHGVTGLISPGVLERKSPVINPSLLEGK